MTAATVAFRATIIASICIASGTLHAQSVERPVLKEGDKWAYSVRVDENKADIMRSSTRNWEASITRAGLQTIILASKPVDSNLPPTEASLNADWSVTRSLNGKNTVTSRPYDFPMKPGKTWKLETLENKPDAQAKTQKITLQYTVVGWEDVKVPAGTFKALKIEAEGEWQKEFETRGASANSAVGAATTGATVVIQSHAAFTPPPVSGRIYRAFWYSPEIKRDVKLVTEDMTGNGTLSKRTTEELESFSVQ
ncbi:hypothetical protein [Glaciimonas sp. PCH181]|uniref:hypothetical protein n=1 Tax=Glaciimonas sp. PCH181 TaxID=2133943 RepID=UPI000D3D3B2E|nr:hypothetical protein [Glaciimonas sp. PCH181]PUA20288.1 hypothetical protein C7W93_11090 [Glaciimonas sp. PCH181]